jgi:predicted protein tyrosine phosphatase
MRPAKTATVHVCALRHLPDMIEQTDARHLVSAIDGYFQPTTPPNVAADRHLRLQMHDIVEARPDATLPARHHVRQLVEFVRGWDRREPMLIHCFAGLSRSTAAAFITLCAINPDTPEDVIARALRRCSDTAVPNKLFVALADAELGREGRMSGALATMGPNRFAAECVPFGVDALHGTHDLNGAHQAA